MTESVSRACNYRARYYNPQLQRFVSEDPLDFRGGVNLYEYADDDPVELTDPLGLYDGWDFLHDAGTFSEAFADTLTFGSASRLNDALAQAAGQTTPVDRCGSVHKLGTAAGIVTSVVIIPNISSWAKNPLLYEVGSTTVPSAVYEGMQGLNAIEKGGYLLSNYGWMGTLRLAGQAALNGEYAATIGAAYGTAGALAGRGCGCH